MCLGLRPIPHVDRSGKPCVDHGTYATTLSVGHSTASIKMISGHRYLMNSTIGFRLLHDTQHMHYTFDYMLCLIRYRSGAAMCELAAGTMSISVRLFGALSVTTVRNTSTIFRNHALKQTFYTVVIRASRWKTMEE